MQTRTAREWVLVGHGGGRKGRLLGFQFGERASPGRTTVVVDGVRNWPCRSVRVRVCNLLSHHMASQ